MVPNLARWQPEHEHDNRGDSALTAVGRRRAIDAFRRRAAADDRYATMARQLDEATPGADQIFNPDAINDDKLALIFTACHPVLPKEARLTLTLKVVGGLTTDCCWSP